MKDFLPYLIEAAGNHEEGEPVELECGDWYASISAYSEHDGYIRIDHRVNTEIWAEIAFDISADKQGFTVTRVAGRMSPTLKDSVLTFDSGLSLDLLDLKRRSDALQS